MSGWPRAVRRWSRNRRWRKGALAVLAAVALVPEFARSAVATAPASAATPRVRAVFTHDPPRLDGRLDDPAWREAGRIERFFQVEPTEGGTPTERTVVLILYDEHALYLGVRCYDREPEKLIARQRLRDANVLSDDRITFAFDTFHDRRSGFLFQITPAGTRTDGLIENNRRFRRQWDTIWYAKARVDAEGWTAEVKIPFQSLSYDPSISTWGLNVLRAIRRRNELVRWANISQSRSFIDMANAGELTGLTEVPKRLGPDAVPGLVVRHRHDRGEDRDFTTLDPSFDFVYRPTPYVTGLLTWNTNFVEAPVDIRQVNLTRFALFFPETRAFFLQDAGIFEFGGLGRGNGLPFFSRRIGLREGRPVGIRGSVKVTGRIGRLNFGALDVQTERDDEVDSKNLAAARVSLNVLEESTVGLIATRGDPGGPEENALVGADLRYRNSRFRGNRVLTFDAWVQRTASSDVSGHEGAWSVRLAYPNDRVNASLRYLELQEGYRPALGFANRVGIRRYDLRGRYRIRPETWLRTVDTGARLRLVTDRANSLESALLTLTWAALANQDGDRIVLRSFHRFERLTEEFEISEGIVLPVRRYRFDRVGVSVSTTRSRPVDVGFDLELGGFFSGTRRLARAWIGWRPSALFSLGLFFEQNDSRLREGNFTTRIARLNLSLTPNPDLGWEVLVQYDNVSRSVGVNSRLRWIVSPGQEIFLVVNQDFDAPPRGLRHRATEVATKVVWTFRF